MEGGGAGPRGGAVDEEVEGGGMGEVAGCGNSDEEKKEKGPAEIIRTSEHNERREGTTDRGPKKTVYLQFPEYNFIPAST
jgi:hypothetical protein